MELGEARVVELPEELTPRTLYLVGDEPGDAGVYLAALLCPCGCGEVVHVNLIEGTSPCWQLTRDEHGRPSLHPSILRRIGCKAHFWIRRGGVEW